MFALARSERARQALARTSSPGSASGSAAPRRTRSASPPALMPAVTTSRVGTRAFRASRVTYASCSAASTRLDPGDGPLSLYIKARRAFARSRLSNASRPYTLTSSGRPCASDPRSGKLNDDELANDHSRRRHRVGAGVLDIVLGVVLVTASGHLSPGIRIAVAIWGLITGTLLLLDGLMLRRARQSPA
jgi:hypothetical protein